MSDGWSPEDGAGYIPTEEGGSERTDDDAEDYERQWEDLSEKVILAQILTELQQIRLLLSDAERSASGDRSTEQTYRCTRCEETMPAGKRERHARQQHKAPEDMIAGMFVEVDG